MKHFYTFFGVSILLLLAMSASAQTNVSGGIYANTTWTKANSPYIVIDSVIVYTGFTLTVEPGVTVKFEDGAYLEILDGSLVALGTATDSITFTSNSASPHSGSWKRIWYNNTTIPLAIDYCVFKYAETPLYFDMAGGGGTINHSYFYMNNECMPKIIYPAGEIKNTQFKNNNKCLTHFTGNIDSCIFENNSSGAYFSGPSVITNCQFLGTASIALSLASGFFSVKNCIFCYNGIGCQNSNFECICNDSLINCNFSQNNIGLNALFSGHYGNFYVIGSIFTNNSTAINGNGLFINNYIYHNQIGIAGGFDYSSFNNYICNNTLYNLKWTQTINANEPNICWCETDSAAIRSKIYDGYVNVAYGLVNISPFSNCDSSAISILTPINCQTVILANTEEENSLESSSTISIYPNPASDYLTLPFPFKTVRIFNLIGEEKYSKVLSNGQNRIDVSGLTEGIYLIELSSGDKTFRQKFMKENDRR